MRARVLFNNTGADQTVEIPQRLLDHINASSSPLKNDLLSRLQTGGSGEKFYVVKGGAPRIFTAGGQPDMANVAKILGAPGTPVYEANGTYIVAAITGDFNFLGFATGTGTAAVKVTSGAFEMLAELEFTIGPLTFSVKGNLGIYTDGVILNLTVSLDLNLL